MGSTDWDKELAKIDRQLESMSDDTLLPAAPGKSPAETAKRLEERRTTSTLGVLSRVVLAIALGIGMLFWPYSARCGVGLFAYLGAAAMVIVAGVWTSVWTWRHRSANAHVLSLLLVFWGIVLAAQEVLPRVGYARPDAAHPAIWMCE